MKMTRMFICIFSTALIFISCESREDQKNASGNKMIDQLLRDQLAAVEKGKRVDPVKFSVHLVS